jgi:large subunit ribosomal protein L25
MQRIELPARSRCTSESPRKLRREGMVPAVMYGHGEGSIVLCFEEREFKKALSSGGANAIFEIVLDENGSKQSHVAMLKEFQRNPMTGDFIHVDFYRIRMDETITTRVPIHAIGEPVGVKEGGLLQYQIREVEVECLPGVIPENFTIDISELAIGDNMAISDLPAFEGVKVLDDPNETILSIVAPRAVEEVEEEEEAEEGAEPELVGEDEEE